VATPEMTKRDFQSSRHQSARGVTASFVGNQVREGHKYLGLVGVNYSKKKRHFVRHSPSVNARNEWRVLRGYGNGGVKPGKVGTGSIPVLKIVTARPFR
jgi:hypothetical protein